MTMPSLMGIPRVLLWIESSNSYGRRILYGIGRRVRESGPWSLFLKLHGQEDRLPAWVTRWRGEGIIARTSTVAMTRRLRRMKTPMVELLGCDRDEPARVHADNASAGRLAAEHLVECGLRNFGFFAFGQPWWVEMYCEGFAGTLEVLRFTCNVYRPPRSNADLLPTWRESMQRAVTRWIRGLPKPVGIFAPAVDFAATVLSTCRSEGFAVPEEVAVIGSGDDPAICNVFTPPLSCVDLPAERIGYHAATLLQRMMAGESSPQETVWIPATHVVHRQSTNLVAIEDQDVTQAMRFIRENAFQGIAVSHVAVEVGVSRRVLERKFLKFLQRTPKEEILRQRIERARLLLAHSEMSIEAVAHHSGFPSFTNLARVFRRETGGTPRNYRNAHRLGARWGGRLERGERTRESWTVGRIRIAAVGWTLCGPVAAYGKCTSATQNEESFAQ